MHDDAPLDEYVPATQGAYVVAPDTGTYVPAELTVQVLLPTTAE